MSSNSSGGPREQEDALLGLGGPIRMSLPDDAVQPDPVVLSRASGYVVTVVDDALAERQPLCVEDSRAEAIAEMKTRLVRRGLERGLVLGRRDGLVPAGRGECAEGQDGSGRSNHPLHKYLLGTPKPARSRSPRPGLRRSVPHASQDETEASMPRRRGVRAASIRVRGGPAQGMRAVRTPVRSPERGFASVRSESPMSTGVSARLRPPHGARPTASTGIRVARRPGLSRFP